MSQSELPRAQPATQTLHQAAEHQWHCFSRKTNIAVYFSGLLPGLAKFQTHLEISFPKRLEHKQWHNLTDIHSVICNSDVLLDCKSRTSLNINVTASIITLWVLLYSQSLPMYNTKNYATTDFLFLLFFFSSHWNSIKRKTDNLHIDLWECAWPL